ELRRGPRHTAGSGKRSGARGRDRTGNRHAGRLRPCGRLFSVLRNQSAGLTAGHYAVHFSQDLQGPAGRGAGRRAALAGARTAAEFRRPGSGRVFERRHPGASAHARSLYFVLPAFEAGRRACGARVEQASGSDSGGEAGRRVAREGGTPGGYRGRRERRVRVHLGADDVQRRLLRWTADPHGGGGGAAAAKDADVDGRLQQSISDTEIDCYSFQRSAFSFCSSPASMRFSSVARWGAPGMKVSWQVTGVSTRCLRPGEPVGRGSGKGSQRARLLYQSCALWATGRKTDRVGPVSGQDAAAQTEACRAEQSGVSQEVGKPAVRRSSVGSRSRSERLRVRV